MLIESGGNGVLESRDFFWFVAHAQWSCDFADVCGYALFWKPRDRLILWPCLPRVSKVGSPLRNLELKTTLAICLLNMFIS